MPEDHDTEPPMDVQRQHRDRDVAAKIHRSIEDILKGYRNEINSLESSLDKTARDYNHLRLEHDALKNKLKELGK